MDTLDRPTFPSADAAHKWMVASLHAQGETCIDNQRFAFLDDEKSLARYHQQANEGCCGCFDREVVIAGRAATVGCNYGH